MRGRPLKIRTNFWTPGHARLLYYCARRVQGVFTKFELDVDELVNVGWLACARRTTNLKGIATNTIRHMIAYVQRAYFTKNTQSINGLDFAIESDPIDVFDDLLTSASGQIDDPITKKMLRLHFGLGLSYNQIAKKCGCSSETVRIRLKKAYAEIVLDNYNR